MKFQFCFFSPTTCVQLLAAFNNAGQFNGDLSKWNVGKVDNMQRSEKYFYFFLDFVLLFFYFVSHRNFFNCISFPPKTCAQLLSAFAYAYLFNNDISKWSVEKVDTMQNSKNICFLKFCFAVYSMEIQSRNDL